MKIPSTMWIAIALVLPPMLIPVVEKFAPTNTYWWSALIVVLLNAIAIIVKINWPVESEKASTPVPGQVTAFSSTSSGDKPEPEAVHSTAAKLLVFGA